MKSLKDTGSFIEWISQMADAVANHGLWKIIKGTIALAFALIALNIALNPEIIFERFVKYKDELHQQELVERDIASEKIKYELRWLRETINADRVWTIEFHNSMYGLGGLPFKWGIMNYEDIEPGIIPISGEYGNFILTKYPLLSISEDVWCGSIEEVKDVDPALYHSLLPNGVTYLSFGFVYSEDSRIGVIGATYCDNEVPADLENYIKKARVKLSIILSKNGYQSKKNT